jgi:hypothetical protein
MLRVGMRVLDALRRRPYLRMAPDISHSLLPLPPYAGPLLPTRSKGRVHPKPCEWGRQTWLADTLAARIPLAIRGCPEILNELSVMVPCFTYTGDWTDWLGPEVLPLLIVQFLPFLILPPLLISAACLWPRHKNAAKACLKIASAVFLVGIVWEMLVL